ncbi:MAG: arsenic efflux protein [Oscillospiraceae bacterium]|nr:arsenic efflux protein [Oscillospiraceae bacterium]
MNDILVHTVIDTLKLAPRRYITYLAMEYLEHKTGDRATAWVNRAGRLGPVIGSLLGVVPQCGFSAATAGFYAGGVVTRGTLIAVFLSTSDEMLPILLSSGADVRLILRILFIKLMVGMIVGLTVDATAMGSRNIRGGINRLCMQENCHCEERSVPLAALTHTLQILGFIFIISLIISLFMELLGADSIRLPGGQLIAALICGLIGLIPNCAASVAITQLWLDGAIAAGPMLTGLLVGSGVGLLVLLRTNRNRRDNLLTVFILYAAGLIFGLASGVIFEL